MAMRSCPLAGIHGQQWDICLGEGEGASARAPSALVPIQMATFGAPVEQLDNHMTRASSQSLVGLAVDALLPALLCHWWNAAED